MASKYGVIHYYEDADIENWCPELTITQTRGIRTFWDMQQNQEIHKDVGWQEKMIEIEMRVSDMKEYQDIAFFHHLILEKTNKKRAMPPLTKPSIHVKMRETLSERQGHNVKLEDRK